MALEGTHIRFALDLQRDLGVKDENAYLSGTVYPDSRYVTGVDREATHECFENRKPETDFEKGWWVHMLPDKIQKPYHERHFASLLTGEPTDRWVTFSAIKGVQDIGDVGSFAITPHLSALDYIETPNSEDVDNVKHYNQELQSLYRNKTGMRVHDYKRFWQMLGIDVGHTDRIIEEMKELLSDSETAEKVEGIYDESLKEARRHI